MQNQTQQNDKRTRFALLPLITALWVTSSKFLYSGLDQVLIEQ